MSAIETLTQQTHYRPAEAKFCPDTQALVGYFHTEDNEDFQIGLDWTNRFFTYARFNQEDIGMEDARLLVEFIETYNSDVKEVLEEFDFQFNDEHYTVL